MMARKHKGFRMFRMVRLAGIELVKQRITAEIQNRIFRGKALQMQLIGSLQSLLM